MPIFNDLKEILTGLSITLAHILRKPVTVQYPEEKRVMPPRFRGSIVLTRDPDGGERCVACYLCSGACPVDCISMAAAEGENGRRYAEWFRINFSRCILCGLCAEACPTLAIQMSPEMFPCNREVLNMVYEKEDLLIDGTGKDPDYNFYRHAGIGVVAPRGANPGEHPPVDARSLLP
jgi:NADH-quinone oxidoreductase subunit I